MVFFLDILSKADYKGVGVSAAQGKSERGRILDNIYKTIKKGNIKEKKDVLAMPRNRPNEAQGMVFTDLGYGRFGGFGILELCSIY